MDSYPTYQSPIRLLEELGVDLNDLSPKNLKLERKRLLLEIQLSEGQIIHIGSKSITKNDVINVFEELEVDDNLPHHLRIYENKPFLNLLEDNSLDNVPVNTHRLHFETYDEKVVFENFVSPYLAKAFDKTLSKAIRDKSFDGFQRILCFANLMIPQDGLYGFRRFEVLCEYLAIRFHNAASEGIFPFKEVSYLWTESFYLIANEADEFYNGIADYLAVTLINFTNSQELSRGRSNYLFKINRAMQKLKCSKGLQSDIWLNTDYFKTESLIQITPSFGVRKTYLAVIAVILTFLICALIFSK